MNEIPKTNADDDNKGDISILKEETQIYELGQVGAENSEGLSKEDSTGCEWINLSLIIEEQEWVVVVDNKDFVAIGSQFDGDGISVALV